MALRALREIDLPSTLNERIVRRFRAATDEYGNDEDNRDAPFHRPPRVLRCPPSTRMRGFGGSRNGVRPRVNEGVWGKPQGSPNQIELLTASRRPDAALRARRRNRSPVLVLFGDAAARRTPPAPAASRASHPRQTAGSARA